MEICILMNNSLITTPEFRDKVQAFKQDMYNKYKSISDEPTPKYDGKGNKIVDRRPDGYDYIKEAYMRLQLDKHFPGWSWEMPCMPLFLGSEWVVTYGTLSIIDESLLVFNIIPPIRKFSATNAARIKYKSGQTHVHENIIDIGNDVSGANSKAFKKAINQLTHIGDDIYNKRIEEEGAGDLETVLTTNPDLEKFSKWMTEKKLLPSEVFRILSISSLDDIGDYKQAQDNIKKAKKWS